MNNKNEADFYIEKLIKKLNVTSNKELAEVLEISPAAISRWKKYNYVNAIKNKCHELGIYNEIFKDINMSQKKTKSSIKKEILSLLELKNEQSFYQKQKQGKKIIKFLKLIPLKILEEFNNTGKIEKFEVLISNNNLNTTSIKKHFTALEAVAIATNKEDELMNDIKMLMKKYLK